MFCQGHKTQVIRDVRGKEFMLNDLKIVVGFLNIAAIILTLRLFYFPQIYPPNVIPIMWKILCVMWALITSILWMLLISNKSIDADKN